MTHGLDGGSSSTAIAASGTRVAVLPAGSFEQHGAHLPLATDSIIVERIAALAGEREGALVLPVIPYGTSAEHVGFAGTVTLSWSTLAALVTDVVRSCHAQGIDTVFVISGHGGNFILNPCLRELRGSLSPGQRAILVPENVLLAESVGEHDLHAGYWETSVMLAIAPRLVDVVAAMDFVPMAARSDLTNTPLREISPSGVWGQPTRATAEDGTRLIDEAVDRVAEYMRSWTARDALAD